MLRNRVPPLTFHVPMATEILDGLENLSSRSHTARSTLGEAVINTQWSILFHYTSLLLLRASDMYPMYLAWMFYLFSFYSAFIYSIW